MAEDDKGRPGEKAAPRSNGDTLRIPPACDNGVDPPVSRDTVPVDLVDPDPDQPRRHIDSVALDELAASIAANGLAVPILVRPVDGRYLIVHGERRWGAAVSLGWEFVPAEVRALGDEEARWIQLAENIGRADLSPIEEANAYRTMLVDGAVSRDTLAARLGKSKSYVAQKLRLLDLPTPLTMLLDRGALSEGHVRQLLRIRGLYTEAHVVGGQRDPDPQRLDPAQEWPVEDRVAAAKVLLKVGRPEDWPAAFPSFPWGLNANDGDVLAAEAGIALHEELAAAGPSYPRWAATATYFAALTVWAGLPVTGLHTVLNAWIERLHAAVIAVDTIHSQADPPDPADRLPWLHWWGHRSDLRHAGLLDDHDHLREDAVRILNTLAALIAPSSCQLGRPHHDEYQAAEHGAAR